jgi:predicted ATP-grasp superfamily ATP-dependent carboligase
VIVGGDYRGLGAVRSLGRRGVPVWVLTDEHQVAALSRYVQRRLPWPDAGDEVRVEFLCRLATFEGLAGWVLLPTGDEAAAFIARNRLALGEHYRLTTPPWEMLRWAYDKRLTYELAAEAGVPCPWTRYPGSRDALADLDCTFPILLKPAYKQSVNEFTHAKAWQVEDHRALLRRYDDACRLVDPDVIMLQELIPGGGEAQFSYAALCKDGQPLASITARRTRQYPLDFGQASTYVETITALEVERLSRRLLAALKYDGLVEVEFKYDRRDGCYKLLDLNPRIWGWHTLGERAGVDFTYLQWQLARGEEVPELRARPGVHWVRMATDVLAVAQMLWRGQITPVGYLRSMRAPLELAILALDDPRPGLVDPLLLLRVRFRRRRK